MKKKKLNEVEQPSNKHAQAPFMSSKFADMDRNKTYMPRKPGLIRRTIGASTRA